MGKRRKRDSDDLEAPVDLASRIGVPGQARPDAAAPERLRRVDGPIESDRAARGRPLLIGANEAPAQPAEVRKPPAIAGERSIMIGASETTARQLLHAAPAPVSESTLAPAEDAPTAGTREAPIATPREAPIATPREAPIVTTREAPSAGEMDLVVTPLPTPDDWHHFELELRRLPGVGPLRIEYYRAGILKLRLRWSGGQRFAAALADLPGYRVGILGEDRSTVQIRVVRAR
jgi:hypothetical protein